MHSHSFVKCLTSTQTLVGRIFIFRLMNNKSCENATVIRYFECYGTVIRAQFVYLKNREYAMYECTC